MRRQWTWYYLALVVSVSVAIHMRASGILGSVIGSMFGNVYVGHHF